MKNRLAYPFAARRWMPPAPSLRRLQFALAQHGLAPRDDLSTLHQSLLRSVESGTAEAAHTTVEVLRRELVLHRKPLSLKNAQSCISTWLGALSWGIRLMQMTEEPVPVCAITPDACSPIIWWREKHTAWARFVYRVTGKLEGIEMFAQGETYDKVKVRRVRVLSQSAPASDIVSEWRQQLLQAPGLNLSTLAYRREDAYFKLSKHPSPGKPAPIILTHYLVLEAEISGAIDGLEGEPLMQHKLRKIHDSMLWRRVLDASYQKHLELVPASEDEILSLADCQKIPGKQLRSWPLLRRGWSPLVQNCKSFQAIIDFSKGPDGWDSEQRRSFGTLTCERYGLVHAESGRAPGWLAHMRTRKPRQVASGRDVVRTSPFNEAITASKEGLLLSRPSGEVVRFAPWNTDKLHFCLGGDLSARAVSLCAELAAQAHAEGKRVMVYGDNENWSKLMNSLTPGKVLSLSESAPVSLNPFSGVTSEEELRNLLPAFINITYDLLGLTGYVAWEALQKHFISAWKLHGENLELKHVANLFRHFGHHDERALQASIDHFTETMDPWVSGKAVVLPQPGITCIDAHKLTSSRNGRQALGSILGQLVMALAYRNAVAANHTGRNGSLTLFAADYTGGSRGRAELVMRHFAKSGGSIGLLDYRFYGEESGIQQAFRADRQGIPRLRIGLAQNSRSLAYEGLTEVAVQALPLTSEDRSGEIAFAVLQGNDTVSSFTLQRPLLDIC